VNLLRGALDVLRHVPAFGRDRVRWYLWLTAHRRRGVRISRKCRVFGVAGVTIGSGTELYADSCVAATALEFYDSVSGPRHGSITIGRDCVIMYGAIVASYGGNIRLGDSVSVNPYCVLYGHGGLDIGDGTRIAARTVIIPANHKFHDRTRMIKDQGLSRKGVRIGRDVWIGTGVTVLDGVTVGDGAVLAAGSVITHDVKPWTVVGGIPASKIKDR